jgi:hypothetical protein
MLKSIVALAFGIVLANSAMADSAIVGRADLLLQTDAHGPLDTQISENAAGHLAGQGAGLPGTNNVIYLDRQAGGVVGQVYGRFVNIVCNATNCVDKGATNLNITVSSANGITKLDGTLAFNFVHVAYSANQISISTNHAAYELNRDANGKFSGNGAYSDIALDPGFDALLSSSGSLQGIAQDPALILALLVSPYCGDGSLQ